MALQKTIGGRLFSISRCSAIEALDLELALGNAQVSEGLGGMCGKLAHAELVRLMTMVFGHCSCEGATITDLNVTFADRPRDIWEAFMAAVEHNLGPLGEGSPTASSAATQPKP